MSDAATLLALAERVEREEPSRELDADVARAFGIAGKERKVRSSAHFEQDAATGRSLGRILRVVTDYPPLTSSLDAAVTLVPKGLCWRVGYGSLLGNVSGAAEVMERGFGSQISKAGGKTAAAALTAACLRARAADVVEGRTE